MYCKGTPVAEIAEKVRDETLRLSELHPELDILTVHIYLQSQDAEAGGGHPHWTCHADLSYGGTQDALDLVNAVLPDAVYHLLFDEEQFEDAAEAFEDALLDKW